MAASTLECRNLVKSFGGLRAVDDLSVAFEPGKATALIGPNGAGKSTLFHLLTGALQPTSGEITYHDRRIDRLPPWCVAREGIGRLFQDVRVFPKLTVLDNVLTAFPGQCGENVLSTLFQRRRVREEEQRNVERALQLLGSVGLEDRTSSSADALSYGQQKLLAIARLLAAGADVLLLDEPTAGVNPEMIQVLISTIRKLAREGKTIVVIEHNMNVVLEIADWVHFIHEGQVVAFGLPDDVLGDRYVRATYLGL